jgi:hypothetical protein
MGSTVPKNGVNLPQEITIPGMHLNYLQMDWQVKSPKFECQGS